MTKMGVPQKAVAWIKPEEYLALEQTSTTKHEYLDGVIYAWQGFIPEAMAGGSRAHNQVIQNLVVGLRASLRPGRCQVYASDVRLRVAAGRAYFYPDVAVTCLPEESAAAAGQASEFSQPCVIFEVLSDSTEAFDRGEKFETYQHIPTLEEYVLVAPRDRRVEVFQRTSGWTSRSIQSGSVRLECLDLSLVLAQVFEGLD
jgi:Uma2 family endonuclease